MFQNLNLNSLNLFLTLFAFLILYFVNQCYIRTYLRIQYYKKQGAAIRFHWRLFAQFKNDENALKHKNFYMDYRDIMEKNPQTKFVAENFGSRVQLICVHPDAAKELLARPEEFQKDKQFIELLIDAGKGSTVVAEENVWKRGRRVLSSAFHYDFLKSAIPIMIDTSREKFAEWKKDENLSNVDLVDHFAFLTGEITGRFFFGKRFGGRKVKGVPITTEVKKLSVDTLSENFTLSSLIFGVKSARLNILPRHRNLNGRIKAMRDECQEMIADSKKNGKKDDTLLSILLELTESEKEGDRLTDEQLTGEFVGLFAAGTDTTSHLLGSTIYFLWKYPNVLQKVKEEVDRELSNFESVTFENVSRMEYTNAVLKETLRLGGPASALFTRIAMKDTKIAGFKVKKGTLLNLHQDVFYRSQKYFSRSDEFIPERWLDNSEFNNDGFKTQPYAYTPFSAGPRNCIGQHLAMIEAKIVIGMFLQTFDFSFSADYEFILAQRFVFETVHPLITTLTSK